MSALEPLAILSRRQAFESLDRGAVNPSPFRRRFAWKGKLRGYALLVDVIEGVKFKDGERVENVDQQQAAG